MEQHSHQRHMHVWHKQFEEICMALVQSGRKLREGKKTHLFELIQQSSNEVDRNYFNQVWGNPGVTMEDVERVRQIGLDTDAKSRVEELMRDYAHQALKSLEQLKLSEAESKPFRELADGAVNRSV